jgi:hypothetical protein
VVRLGLFLSAFVALACVAWAVWDYVARDTDVVGSMVAGDTFAAAIVLAVIWLGVFVASLFLKAVHVAKAYRLGS